MKATITKAIEIALVLCDIANNTNLVVPHKCREALVEAREWIENMSE